MWILNNVCVRAHLAWPFHLYAHFIFIIILFNFHFCIRVWVWHAFFFVVVVHESHKTSMLNVRDKQCNNWPFETVAKRLVNCVWNEIKFRMHSTCDWHGCEWEFVDLIWFFSFACFFHILSLIFVVVAAAVDIWRAPKRLFRHIKMKFVKEKPPHQMALHVSFFSWFLWLLLLLYLFIFLAETWHRMKR